MNGVSGSAKVDSGTDPLEQEADPAKGQGVPGPSKVDSGTDPLEPAEAGPSRAKMEESRKTPDLTQRGSRNLAQIEEGVDTSKMKNVGRWCLQLIIKP